MKLWNHYVAVVNRNCSGASGKMKDISYWRNNLFAGTIIYLLPFCLIALIPGIYLSVVTGKLVLAIVDIATAAGMGAVAFVPGIGRRTRKTIFICCFYALSCALLYYLGLHGPGLVYLLAACIFGILIFPTTHIYWPAWLNTAICIVFIAAVVLKLLPDNQYTTFDWLTVTSNLVFLSFLSAALIPRLFAGLQETLDNEKKLQEELNKQQQSLERALDMLQEKNDELRQFAYVASHDLQEPLRMITSFMGLLKNRYNNRLDEKAHTYMDFAINGGRRMQKMIADLLVLSRTAHADAVLEQTDLNQVLAEVKQNIFKLTEDNQAEIIIQTKLPVLPAYRSDLLRLLQNLLSNAIKFRKKEIRPVILINAEEQETEWLFSVSDNGIGIPPGKTEKIFDVFTRLHAQSAYEGTGIGLAVCKKAIEYHGGKIWVESSEGQGSTFYFTLQKIIEPV